jgi:hypothetical protein
MDPRRLIPVTLVATALVICLAPPGAAHRPGGSGWLGGPAAGVAAAAGGPSRYIAVRTMGSARNESTDPLRQRFTFPLYSLTDGSLVGTATDDLACSQTVPPPCAVFDAITTFRFTQGTVPAGTIVNHAEVSVAPDAQRPGFVINGARSTQPTIQGGSGAYAGRTGIVILSGANDIRGFPNELAQDDLWLIQLQ